VTPRLCAGIAGGKEHASRAGFSLIELVATILLLIIVFSAWVNISNFQAVRKESLRRAALEEAAGMLDFVSREKLTPGYHRVYFDEVGQVYEHEKTSGGGVPNPCIHAMFEESDPIGYILRVEKRTVGGWPANEEWAEIQLYDQHGVADPGRPFSRLAVYMMD
jgi:hypothetical protein